MDSILDELYAYLYRPDPLCVEKQAQLWAEYLPLCQQVQDAFGLDFLDRFTLLKSEVDGQNGRSQFRQGFRLGAQLMLEVFSPLTSARP